MRHCNGWTMGLSFKGPLLAPIPEGTEGKSFDELVESREDRTATILLKSCELARMLFKGVAKNSVG
jgi:hypothetical protein